MTAFSVLTPVRGIGRRFRTLTVSTTATPSRPWQRRATLAAACLVAAGSLAQLGVRWATALPSDAALRVGEAVVTKQDLQHRMDVLGALYGVQQPKDGAQLAQFHRDGAKSVAVSMILSDAAREHGIVISDQDARNDLNTVIQKNYPQGREAFIQTLGANGASEQDVLNELKSQLEVSKLFDAVTKSVPAAADSEVSAAVAARSADAFTPEKRHLRNIVVRDEQQARQLAAQASSGADFGALAKQSSIDQSTKDNGGDLGTVASNQLDPQYANTAFAGTKGSVFGPVKTQYGWNVGQVADVAAAQQLPLDQVKQNLTNRHRFAVWQDWLAKTIAGAHAEYADDYRPADPDAAPPIGPS